MMLKRQHFVFSALTFCTLLVKSNCLLAQEYILARNSGISPILKKKKEKQQSKNVENTALIKQVYTEIPENDSFLETSSSYVVENYSWQKEGKCEMYENYFGWKDDCETVPSAKIYKQVDETCSEKVWLSDTLAVSPKYLFKFPYYNIWDTKTVDPYDFDIRKITEYDSITLQLYNIEEGKSWSPPLYKTTKNSDFGFRRYRWHHGIDLDLNIGDSIFAVFDGIVRIAKYNRGGYGWYVLIRHENGLETLYGHLSKYFVKPGQEIKAGQLIGLGGNTGRSTGPHLHFEVRYFGRAFNPEAIFDFDNDTLKYQYFTLTQKHYQEQLNRSKAQFHRVRTGDTIGKLASMYGTSVATICRLNGISKKTILRPGRSIRIR